MAITAGHRPATDSSHVPHSSMNRSLVTQRIPHFTASLSLATQPFLTQPRTHYIVYFAAAFSIAAAVQSTDRAALLYIMRAH
jgi:hypothetical protein